MHPLYPDVLLVNQPMKITGLHKSLWLSWDSSADLDYSLAAFMSVPKVTETVGLSVLTIIGGLTRPNGDSRQSNQKGDRIAITTLSDTVKS
jgi:hypothetical protein